MLVAARRVKVSSNTDSGFAPISTSRATRYTSVRVLPVPAPATISSGPSVVDTARSTFNGRPLEHQLCTKRSNRHSFTKVEIAFQSAEFDRQLADGLITILGQLRQSFVQNALEISRRICVSGVGQPRVAMQNCVHRVDTIVVNKGSEAGYHFAQDHAKREDVTTAIHSLSQQLFRSHVIDSAH